MSEKKANKILDKDRDHEFWTQATPETVVRVFNEMIANGISPQGAMEWIQAIYHAAETEYGD